VWLLLGPAVVLELVVLLLWPLLLAPPALAVLLFG
jgi:hypothetical protein